MDESLFVKHFLQIKKQKDSKEEILLYIQEKTGIALEEGNITIVKKQILFQVSSVVKQKLFQKNINDILGEKGFSTRF